MKWKLCVLAVILMGVLLGCNLPLEQKNPLSPDVVNTRAAGTISAELTRIAQMASPTNPISTSTSTPSNTPLPLPTNTTVIIATNTPIPCNLASFVTDVTYPDNTHVPPGQVFIKTWRIRNSGSCAWNSNYSLVFDHQDRIGVSAGYSQPLTTGSINPGQDVDLSVNLTAPLDPGTYTGYWRLRDPGGVLFGITPSGGTFLVKIIVVATTTITLKPVAAESGTVQTDAGPFPEISAGECTEDLLHACEAFLSFNISEIPHDATITQVKINFKDYVISGDPFGSLGVLNGYVTNYGKTLSSSDFVAGFPTGNILDWGSVSPLDILEVSPELKGALQSKIGSARLQLRLQFAGSNKDAVTDKILFNNPSLLVSYTTP
jgi:hypothetical protein